MSLSDYTDAELRAELARRCGTPARRCLCGGARREIVHESKGFYPRTGCLTCNNWDDKPRLNGQPTV